MANRDIESLEESFLYTNIVPQKRDCNHPVMSKIEARAIKVAKEEGKINLIVGAVYGENTLHRGKVIQNKGINIPSMMYTIITKEDGSHECYIVPNEDGVNSKNLKEEKYTSNIREVRKVSGINF